MTTSTRNRFIALASVLVAGSALAFIAFGNIGQNLVYYWSPAEMLGKGEHAYGTTIRLGGVVQRGSLQWDAEHTHLRFRVADDAKAEGSSVLVSSTEVPPQMFREGIGVVVEGTYDRSGVFTSHRLMVNHSNEYRPPKPGEAHEDWKKTVAESDNSTASKP
jgi:cytochrome c-type biogenesis protein CcmE